MKGADRLSADFTFDVGGNQSGGRPAFALELRRRNIDPEFLRECDNELDGLHRIENLQAIERQIRIFLDFVGLGDGFQYFNYPVVMYS